MIRITTFEANSKKETVDIRIPSPGRFLQTIERLMKSINKVRIYHETRRHFHENLFRDISMKKYTFYIHLVDLPSKMSSKGENEVNKVQLCNRRKGLNVFDSFLLRKYFHDQKRFMTFKNTFRGKFGFVDPSTFQNVLPLRSRK